MLRSSPFLLLLLPPVPSSLILLPSGHNTSATNYRFLPSLLPVAFLQSCLSVFVTMAKHSIEGSDAFHNKNRRAVDDDFDKQRALYVTFLIPLAI